MTLPLSNGPIFTVSYDEGLCWYEPEAVHLKISVKRMAPPQRTLTQAEWMSELSYKTPEIDTSKPPLFSVKSEELSDQDAKDYLNISETEALPDQTLRCFVAPSE